MGQKMQTIFKNFDIFLKIFLKKHKNHSKTIKIV